MSQKVTEIIRIAAEPQWSNPLVPRISVRLPLVAQSANFKNGLFGLLAFLTGILFAFAGVALALGVIHGGFPHDGVAWVVVAFVPLSLLVSITFIGAALTCLIDILRDGSVLEIATDGLRDHRSSLTFSWPSVRSASLFYTRGGIAGIDLQLDRPVMNWQSPFRVGVFGQRFRVKPDHIIVPIGFLDKRPHILAHTIIVLIQRHGGEIIDKSPSMWTSN